MGEPVTRARQLRLRQADAERKLWAHLRARQLEGFKFRRQQPIGPYIVDFCCLEQKLVVELDGSQHITHIEADDHRSAFLRQEGFRVLRFWDNDLKETNSVLQQILEAAIHPEISQTICSPSPHRGRGAG